jgi:hypothetical protein
MAYTKQGLILVGRVALCVLMGCGERDSTDVSGATPSDPDPNTGNGVADEPAYVVSTRVFSPDGGPVTSFFYVVDSLDEGTTLDPSQGLESPGSARLFANEETGWFAIGSGEDSTITRYTVGPTGLIAGDSMSLQPYGRLRHRSSPE